MIYLIFLLIFLGLIFQMKLKVGIVLTSVSLLFIIPFFGGYMYKMFYINFFFILLFCYCSGSLIGKFFKILIIKKTIIYFIFILLALLVFNFFEYDIIKYKRQTLSIYQIDNNIFNVLKSKENSANYKKIIYNDHNFIFEKEKKGDYSVVIDLEGDVRIFYHDDNPHWEFLGNISSFKKEKFSFNIF